MKKVLVTGANGFIGKNLCNQLRQDDNVEVLCFGREHSRDDLKLMLKQADFIFHIAGVNRPKDDQEFELVNKDLTKEIVDILSQLNKKTPILLTSSTQATLDNAYGKSKKAAEDVLIKWAKTSNSKVYIYRLPNVFGKWCKPDYNSVVATFCNNIALGKEIQINDSKAELNLVYIDDVVGDFILSMNGKTMPDKKGNYNIEHIFSLTLQGLADKLYEFRNSRKTLQMPSLESDIDRYLYATYTSYFHKDKLSYNLEIKHDDRGWLAEFIKSSSFGQIFISRTKPGITRGNHWHNTKIEKFLVIEGEAEIKFRHLQTNEVASYKVSGEELRVLDIPAGHTHSIKNIGRNELITIFWADVIFDQANPDTYYLEV